MSKNTAPTFNVSNGLVTTDFGSYDAAYGVVVQSDGKILVAGTVFSDQTGNDFALLRYNSNGSLDTNFSDDGVQSTVIDSYNNDIGYSVVLQSDGKILVGGVTLGWPDYNFALVRYNRDGSLDSTFNDDGMLVY